MNCNPAQDAVLSTPEILATILHHLPVQHLLVNAQRVSHTWHDLISHTPSLQHRLFFSSLPASPSIQPPGRPEHNPLLSAAFPPLFNGPPSEGNFAIGKWGQEELGKLAWNKIPSTRAAYSRPEASWRKMLVYQPPVTKFEIEESYSAHTGVSVRRGEVEINPRDGLRMGLLYAVLQNSCTQSSHEWTVFRFEWKIHDEYRDKSQDENVLELRLSKGFSCVSIMQGPMPDLDGGNWKDVAEAHARNEAALAEARPRMKGWSVPATVKWQSWQPVDIL